MFIQKKLHTDNKNEKRALFGIKLEDIDGYQFESLVGDIYSSLGYFVKNIKKTGDAGRDLIIEKDGFRTLVECKHQKGSIGRPVIQKIHSAVIVDPKADRGVVVTTSIFSKQAVEYASKSEVPISLIDLPQLRKMSLSANYKLLEKGERLEIGHYAVQDISSTFSNILKYIEDRDIVTVPHGLDEVFKPFDWSIDIQPAYRIHYRIDHVTQTSVGVLYSVHESGVIHISATNWKLLSLYDKFFDKQMPIINSNNPRTINIEFNDVFFERNSKLVYLATSHIISKYRKIVSYKGRNNVRYKKNCVPTPNNINIKNIMPVYILIQNTTLKALNRIYNINVVENNKNNTMIISDDVINVCNICNTEVKEKKYLCNSCGNLAHTPSWWKRSSHSYTCEDCGKTICRDCGYWINKWIFMKRIICEDCLKKGQNKKYEKIPSLPLNNNMLESSIRL